MPSSPHDWPYPPDPETEVDWRALYVAQASVVTGIDYRLRAVEDAIQRVGNLIEASTGEAPWHSLTRRRGEIAHPDNPTFRRAR